jgi:replicative DNA helicase
LPPQVPYNEKDIMSSVRNAHGPEAQAAQAAQDRQVAALKLPPHSIEAEQSLIGGLLLDNSTWDRVGDQVNESDFYRDDHRRIFRHIARLIEQGKPADVVTVYESVEKADEVSQTGGLAYLGEIANNTPSGPSSCRWSTASRSCTTGMIRRT